MPSNGIYFVLLGAAVLSLRSAGAASAEADLNRIWRADFAGPPTASSALRVLDWNIDRGKRLAGIEAALGQQQADIYALQEVDMFADRSGDRNIAEVLARRLKLNYVFAPEFQELGQGSAEHPAFQGQAVLTKLPIRAARVIRFHTQSGFWKPRPFLPNWAIFQRRRGGRIALVVELSFRGGTLVVYNTHLESRSFGRIQEQQLDEILADAKGHYTKATPIVLTGDLNSKYNPWTFSARLRRAGWTSAFGSRTPRTHLIIGSLDWLLVHGPLDVRHGKVVRGAGASDHFPIVASVSSSASQSNGGL